jgi:hypothetical protein
VGRKQPNTVDPTAVFTGLVVDRLTDAATSPIRACRAQNLAVWNLTGRAGVRENKPVVPGCPPQLGRPPRPLIQTVLSARRVKPIRLRTRSDRRRELPRRENHAVNAGAAFMLPGKASQNRRAAAPPCGSSVITTHRWSTSVTAMRALSPARRMRPTQFTSSGIVRCGGEDGAIALTYTNNQVSPKRLINLPVRGTHVRLLEGI